jgi:hypothetical protein
MVSYKSLATLASLTASAFAVNVDCKINGASVATVDLDTGSCPFPIPNSLVTKFDVVSLEDYAVSAFYIQANNVKYFNDIAAAGRIIQVSARALFENPITGLFNVNISQTPASNSSSALRRRFFDDKSKRATQKVIDQVVAIVKSTPGTPIDAGGKIVFEAVISPNQPSSSSSHSYSTSTQTNTETTVITITSCDEYKCHTTTASATKGPVTTVIGGTTTVFTTWCPITTETHTRTKIITITSCDDHKCHEVTTPATKGPITTTVGGKETVYTTWCPVAETYTITVTKCINDVCVYSTVPATKITTTITINGTPSVSTIITPVAPPPTTATTIKPTVVIPTTVIPTTVANKSVAPSTTPQVTTYPGAAAKFAAPLVLAMIPLLNFL